MPLDTTTSSHRTYVEELAIIDRTVELIRTPRRWTKHTIVRHLIFPPFRAYCLASAFSIAAWGNCGAYVRRDKKVPEMGNRSLAAAHVWDKLLKATKPWNSVAKYNDHKRTTHSDVLRLLAEVRQAVVETERLSEDRSSVTQVFENGEKLTALTVN